MLKKFLLPAGARLVYGRQGYRVSGRHQSSVSLSLCHSLGGLWAGFDLARSGSQMQRQNIWVLSVFGSGVAA